MKSRKSLEGLIFKLKRIKLLFPQCIANELVRHSHVVAVMFCLFIVHSHPYRSTSIIMLKSFFIFSLLRGLGWSFSLVTPNTYFVKVLNAIMLVRLVIR